MHFAVSDRVKRGCKRVYAVYGNILRSGGRLAALTVVTPCVERGNYAECHIVVIADNEFDVGRAAGFAEQRGHHFVRFGAVPVCKLVCAYAGKNVAGFVCDGQTRISGEFCVGILYRISGSAVRFRVSYFRTEHSVLNFSVVVLVVLFELLVVFEQFSDHFAEHVSGRVGIGSDEADIVGFVDGGIGYLAVEEDGGFVLVFAFLREVVARSLKVYRVDDEQVRSFGDRGVDLRALGLLVVLAVVERHVHVAVSFELFFERGADGGDVAVVVLVSEYRYFVLVTALACRQSAEHARAHNRGYNNREKFSQPYHYYLL